MNSFILLFGDECCADDDGYPVVNLLSKWHLLYPSSGRPQSFAYAATAGHGSQLT